MSLSQAVQTEEDAQRKQFDEQASQVAVALFTAVADGQFATQI